ncbi:DNA primase [bacterium]|nr:DNA primase [bacterium]
MPDIVADIKARLNIEDVVSQYVHLKQSGKNFKGLCPFHDEKTPSFMVSPEKQIAYCFGCHKGGDIINFIQEVEGVEFKDAIKILADKAGIDIADYQFTGENSHSKSEKTELHDMHVKVSAFYEDKLWNTEKGSKVLEYLRGRGLKDETIHSFHFGLSPDSFDETHMYLVKAGYSRKMIALAGLAIAKNTQVDNVYDRFRARLMIPIYDHSGRIIGFGGRALKQDDQPKYLNSPDSPIYNKSEVLYGYNFAKDSIKKNDKVILVEGYFDVIMSNQVNITNVVATSGTALTLPQIKLIKRFTKNMIFSFDTDSAGRQAAKRGFELAQSEGMNVEVITGLNAKDPADFIKENSDDWALLLNKVVPFMQFCIDDVIVSNDSKSLKGKKQILDTMMPFFHMLTSSFEKDYFVRELARNLDIKEVVIYDELKNSKIHNSLFAEKKNKSEELLQSSNEKINSLDLLLGLIFEHPLILEDVFSNIPEKMLEENEKSIYKGIKDNYNLLRAEGKRNGFLACLKLNIRQRLEMISLFIDELYGMYSEEMIQSEAKKLLDKVTKRLQNKQRRDISAQIRTAEKEGDTETAKKLLTKLQQLVSS